MEGNHSVRSQKPLLASLPHSGELIPAEAPWLEGLPERLLMFDVDRFVDVLYAPAFAALGMAHVKSDWHRYAVDLNRWTSDVDVDSVAGAEKPSGSFPRGLHWSITTKGDRLMPHPMSRSVHEAIVRLYFEPFHERVRAELERLRERGAAATFHVDLHSMPSIGTNEHRDPGERRADVVISDLDGRSCSAEFKDFVIRAYSSAGFKVACNWPYKGGRLTETYGRPERAQHAIQIELNRALYMDEETKLLRPDRLAPMQGALLGAMGAIHDSLLDLPTSPPLRDGRIAAKI